MTFTLITAVQMGLTGLGNITDFETNHQFVIHVLSMDTTFKTTMWRAISSPAVATVTYVAIIVWELAAAALLFAAAFMWMRPGTDRHRETARQLSSAGWLMWVVLFGGGFVAIGNEWFSMWQSETWNGLQAAFQNLVIAAIGLILVHLRPARTAVEQCEAA
ncbi:DUF2165 domain-containing protein [Pseudonocardia sp. TRM90224]|uniref:DUF2165 domain-containing protein n=1 Tax=Pseudonocardia sp. TRM90224 TaxID=2812678 RepID=UPI001E53E9EB|nr:DUF2165 domain-containing protein [Pseudonocardia sp. TRM90224]